MPSREEMIAALQTQIDELKGEKPAYDLGRPEQKDHKPAGATPTTVKGWKKANAERDLTLPSGNVCLVKRPGLPELIAQGVIPDTLMPFAQEAVKNAETGRPDHDANNSKIAELMSAPGGMDAMFEAMDRVSALCVIEPPVRYHKQDDGRGNWIELGEGDRDPEVLYTDEVDFDDKVFIFTYVVGGTSDLESFRKATG